MIRAQDKKPGPDDGVMMVSRVMAATSINIKRSSVAADHYRAKRLAKKGIFPVRVAAEVRPVKSLTLDNETKEGSYWARQPTAKVRTAIADKGRPVEVPLIGAELDAVLEAARKTDRKPWWNESQQRWFVGADTAEAWANVNR